jgi:hypothetical protein
MSSESNDTNSSNLPNSRQRQHQRMNDDIQGGWGTLMDWPLTSKAPENA